ISGSSTPAEGYQSPPASHAIGSSVNDETGRHTPPVMSSSTRHSAQRWDHIENLDRFFTLVYEYHQGGGFLTIAVKKLFSLVQFVFVVFTSALTEIFAKNVAFIAGAIAGVLAILSAWDEDVL
ncbi:hypothetical protein OSTOST_14285, partial [Ostertagia ostertagi]